MRKLLFVVGIISISLSLFANGAKESGSKAKVNDDKVYKMRIATVVKGEHPWILAINDFILAVDKRTNGKVKINLQASGVLGNDASTFEDLRMGTVDFTVGGTTTITSFIPELQIFSIPYLFSNYEDFNKVVAKGSPVFRIIDESYKSRDLGVVLLALGGGGVRNVSNALKPINTPEDMKGLKMRVPGSPLASKIWRAAGAIPSPLPWGEIYASIQTGVINTFESSISGYSSSRLFEVAPYHTGTQHQYMTSHFSMSSASLAKLPEEYKQIIIEEGAKLGTLMTKYGREKDEKILKELIDVHNVKYNEPDIQSFIDFYAGLQDELAAEVKNGPKILAEIRNLIK